MKCIFFFMSITLSSFLVKAQKTAPPVVALDKLNVFYYGVDNPISISSPVDFSQTIVTITNGNISGSGTHRIVRPNTIGQNSIITVTANGKSIDYYFRVKRIPDPVFRVGSGKSHMDVTEFKAQQVCRAELENFDFDLSYKVVSAMVYFSGKGFETVSQAHLLGNNLDSLSAFVEKCEPGTLVTFDDIKVEGPDGVRTLDGRTYTLY